MEEQKNEQEELNLYADFKSDIEYYAQNSFDKHNETTLWENTWFYVNDPCEEDARMCVLVLMAIYEIEHNNISQRIIDEVEYYFDEVFVQRSFDDTFTDKKAEKECFEDIKWCYEKLKEKGLL